MTIYLYIKRIKTKWALFSFFLSEKCLTKNKKKMLSMDNKVNDPTLIKGIHVRYLFMTYLSPK